MKFYQFLEAQTILERHGLSFEDVKDKTPDELNEIFGINKAILSWGANKVWVKKLENNKKKVEAQLKAQVDKGLEKLKDVRLKRQSQLEEIGEKDKGAYQKLMSNITRIEGQIIQVVNKLSSNVIDKVTKQITTRIEGSEKLKQGAKDGLLFQWELMMADAKMNVLAELMDKRILTTQQALAAVKSAKEEKEVEMKEKEKDLNDKHEGDNDSEMKDTEDTIAQSTDQIEKYMDKLVDEEEDEDEGDEEEANSTIEDNINKFTSVFDKGISTGRELTL